MNRISSLQVGISCLMRTRWKRLVAVITRSARMVLGLFHEGQILSSHFVLASAALASGRILYHRNFVIFIFKSQSTIAS